LGLLLVTLPFTWTYLLGCASGTHHTCIEDFDSNKTGLTKNSMTIEESRDKKVFIKALKVDKKELQLDSLNKVQIKNVWVETLWKYECLDTGLTVIPLGIPSVIIEIDDYQKFYESGHQIMYGDKYAGFSGVLSLSADILSNDTVSLIIVNKDRKQTDRIKLTGKN
jgi:hypothetical protein